MADILAFDRYAGDPDPEGMSGEELREYLDAVEARLRALDEEGIAVAGRRIALLGAGGAAMRIMDQRLYNEMRVI